MLRSLILDPCYLLLTSTVNSLPFLAPVFLIFEVWQLFISERYLGIKQIARGADPRALGLGELTAFIWSASIFTYWTWMLLIIFAPTGRVHGIALFAISMLGFVIRRGAPLKWVLVILTLEGAIRVGLLFSLCGMLWWRR
jgi:hypothetical protein